MDKQAISQVAFHDRVALPQQSGLARLSAAVTTFCGNKLRRHLAVTESLGQATRLDFQESAAPEAWADSDSVFLTGFADSVSEDEVQLTLEVRAEAAPKDAAPLVRGKLVFPIKQQARYSGLAEDRRVDHELRALVERGALMMQDAQLQQASSLCTRNTRTVRAFAATQALGHVIKLS